MHNYTTSKGPECRLTEAAVAQIVEVNDEGALYLPSDLLSELLGDSVPRNRLVLEAQGECLVLTRLKQAQPFWLTATPEERAAAFLEWASVPKSGPGLPLGALPGENIYE